jgi:hypothetical protein
MMENLLEYNVYQLFLDVIITVIIIIIIIIIVMCHND